MQPTPCTLQVLEFESLGVRVRNTKRFMILNPTGISYEFFWEPVKPAAAGPGAGASPFHCATRRGVISAGRQFEMVFEYTPLEDVVAESFWVSIQCAAALSKDRGFHCIG